MFKLIRKLEYSPSACQDILANLTIEGTIISDQNVLLGSGFFGDLQFALYEDLKGRKVVSTDTCIVVGLSKDFVSEPRELTAVEARAFAKWSASASQAPSMDFDSIVVIGGNKVPILEAAHRSRCQRDDLDAATLAMEFLEWYGSMTGFEDESSIAAKIPEIERVIVEEEAEVEEDDYRRVPTRFKSKVTPFGGCDKFFDTGNPFYSVEEMLYHVKKTESPVEFGVLRKLIEFTREEAAALYSMQKKYGILDIFSGENASFVEGVRTTMSRAKYVNKAGEVVEPRSLESVRRTDSITARIPQAETMKSVFIPVNNAHKKGEFKVYMNLFDSQSKLYSIGSTKNLTHYALSQQHITRRFQGYLDRHETFKPFVALVPMTQNVEQNFSDDKIDLLANIAMTGDKKDVSTIGIDMNSIGGRLYSEGTGGERVKVNVGALSTIIGKGMPVIYKLRGAYHHDESFARLFDEVIFPRVAARISRRKPKLDEDWRNAVREIYRNVQVAGKYKKGEEHDFVSPSTEFIVRSVNAVTYGLKEGYDFIGMVDRINHMQRRLLKNLSQDVSVYTDFGVRMNILPCENLVIKAVNDLLFKDYDVKVNSALDYISTGYLLSSGDNQYRTRCHPEDKVMLKDNALICFDYKPKGRPVTIDLHFCATKIYVGGVTWIDKITRRTLPQVETRSHVLADFEPDESTGKGKDMKFPLVNPKNNAQWVYVRRRLEEFATSEDHYMALVIPLRYIFEAANMAKLVLILPMAYPCLTCVYALFKKNTHAKVGQAVIYQMAYYFFIRSEAILDNWQNGLANVRQNMTNQVEVEADSCLEALISTWWNLLGQRHKEGSLAPNALRIKEDVRSLIGSTKKTLLKVDIEETRKDADDGRSFFRLGRI